jgi:hypothetical protein
MRLSSSTSEAKNLHAGLEVGPGALQPWPGLASGCRRPGVQPGQHLGAAQRAASTGSMFKSGGGYDKKAYDLCPALPCFAAPAAPVLSQGGSLTSGIHPGKLQPLALPLPLPLRLSRISARVHRCSPAPRGAPLPADVDARLYGPQVVVVKVAGQRVRDGARLQRVKGTRGVSVLARQACACTQMPGCKLALRHCGSSTLFSADCQVLRH